MAKVLGLTNTTIKGKIGNTIFYTRKAQSLARMYQPTVANPKTVLQVRQRNRMALSVDLNKKIRTELQKLYGTDAGSYEYQGVQKVIMNSLIIKQINAQKSGDALTYNNLNIKNITSALGKSYNAESLNIFDPGVTIDASTVSTINNVNFATAKYYDTGVTAWQDLKSEDSENIVVFGCDYELSSDIALVTICPLATSTAGEGTPSYNMSTFQIQPLADQVTAYNGVRRRGMIRCEDTSDGIKVAMANCGSGWKYYYKMALPTDAPYLGTIAPAFNYGQGEIGLYNICFILAMWTASETVGIQTIKGVSVYNTAGK